MTYKSGGRSTQVDYIISRRAYLKEIGDGKVVAGDSIAKQHRLLVCRMTLEPKKRKKAKAEPRLKWWKLKKEDCYEEFREEIRPRARHMMSYTRGWTLRKAKRHCTDWRDRHQAEKDVQQVRMMKDKDGNVMTGEERVLII